jgi:hypothetical protein
VLPSRVVLIATPDERHRSVAKNLAPAWRQRVAPERLCCTPADRARFSVLQPLAEPGRGDGIDAPDANLFSNQNIPDLANCVFGIDGAPAALQSREK